MSKNIIWSCFLATLFMFTQIIAVAQISLNNQLETRNVVIQGRDSYIELKVLARAVKGNTNNNLTYHWFRANEIHQTQGGHDNNLLHGEYNSFYPNKNLKEKGQFNRGLKTGEWKSWFENGRIDEIVNWKNGVQNGLYKNYNSNGELTLEANYANGRLHGKMLSYQSGKLLKESNYKNGEEIVTAEDRTTPKQKKKLKDFWPFKKKDKNKKDGKEDTPPKEQEKEDNAADDTPKKS